MAMPMTEEEANEILLSQDRMTKSILVDFLNEYKRSCEKHPDWIKHSMVKKAAILSEEAGELIRAALQYEDENGSIMEMYLEAVQTGAMAIKFIKNIR